MARTADSVFPRSSKHAKRSTEATSSHLPSRLWSSEARPKPTEWWPLQDAPGDPRVPPIKKNPANPPGDGSSPILTLSNDLLRDILDLIEADPDKGVNIDRRAYLSQESFKPPPKPSLTRAQDLGNWRRTCRQLSEIGAIHQFARVTTRFSHWEFQRLEWLAKQTHLTKHVKKFSYMVPYFYVEGRDRVNDVLPTLSASLGGLDVQVFITKIKEQKRIVQSKEDLKALKKAMSAFEKLQHIQILPVQDYQDSMLLSYIRQNNRLTQYVELKWEPACFHSTKTIGEAMLESHSPCTRFSSPHLSPQSAVHLTQPGVVAELASQLTCIELHFDDGFLDLDRKMRDLSPLFKTVFDAARKLEAVHIGFPSHRPLTLPLEALFHNIRWEKLLAFGIQGWKLDGDEIISLASRHRLTLKGLRLRDVLLNEGSMWKDVLDFLRNKMLRLDWVSLRRIGYATQFDEQWAVGGEMPDDIPGGTSSSSEDEFDNAQDDRPDTPLSDDSHHHTASHDSDLDSIGSDSTSHHEHSDDEHVVAANQVDLPQLAPDTPTSIPWCNCGDNRTDPQTAEELGDNGVYVSNTTRKLWEKWVVGRCPQHAPR